MQYWRFETLIYDGNDILGYTHASVPIGFFVEKNIVRVFFSARNKLGQSLPFFLDYDLDLRTVVYLHTKPLLELGALGSFDDSGVMPTEILKVDDEIWMYYIGWNLGVSVPFRNSLGIAVSKDNGVTFQRKFQGPILDRTKEEPYFNASACILRDNQLWRIWYLSCTGWNMVNAKPRHSYHIKTAISSDGINWQRTGEIAIDYKYENEYAISVPRVIFKNGVYQMWYSYRGGLISDNYTIGYSTSNDGSNWQRNDEEINMTLSTRGWDSDMVCYPFLFEYNGMSYMLYNGNGYGKTGIGLATLRK
jgi:hypothetical protein